jgi:flap endonuclease-1
MGIKNLKVLIDKCPKAVKQIPLSFFRGKRISIDANNWMIITMAPAWSQTVKATKYPEELPNMDKFIQLWCSSIKAQVEKLIIAGITPVYVFDGSSPPEKHECQEERKRKREITEKKYNQAMETLTSFKNQQTPIELMDEVVDKRINELVNEIRKYAAQLWPHPTELSNIIKPLLISIGIPVLMGKDGYEAERICANLCLDGYCSATFSTDRDTLAHGCPLIINKFLGSIHNGSKMEEMVETINLHQILIELNLTFKEFVDVCIMSGCDYNKNIRGIGAIKSWTLIKDHHSIEELPKNMDISILKHQACRQLFSKINSIEMVEELPYLKINLEALTTTALEFLSNYQIEDWIKTLTTLYSLISAPPMKDSEAVSPPDIRISRENNSTLILVIV